MFTIQQLENFRVPPQTDPPRSPRETLPTMYDLPSEDPKESGLPDEFHYYQPQLLRETFQPPLVTPDRVFVGTDINLYYTLAHPLWHKRPDWFAVLDVSRFYEGHELRMSYVMWQEDVAPYLVVELLSPGTEQEDMGRTQRASGEPHTKWEVYTQILRVPYYVVFSRYTNVVHYFVRQNGSYHDVQPADQRLWLPQAGLGIGIWEGNYQGNTRKWLRFYDGHGAWIATPVEHERERTEHERQRAEHERQRAERLAAQLKALGLEPGL